MFCFHGTKHLLMKRIVGLYVYQDHRIWLKVGSLILWLFWKRVIFEFS